MTRTNRRFPFLYAALATLALAGVVIALLFTPAGLENGNTETQG